jgi:hypothetical protein
MEADVKGYLSECLKMRNGEALNSIQSMIWADVIGDRSSHEIIEAITLAIKTTTGRLTPDKVFSCFKSEHPSPEAAWNAIPKSEDESAYLSQEMLQAMSACQDSLDRGDFIAARMAFIETYKTLINNNNKPVFYLSRSNHENAFVRESNDNHALEEAESKGWITCEEKNRLRIEHKGGDLKKLENQITEEQREIAKAKIQELRDKLKG